MKILVYTVIACLISAPLAQAQSGTILSADRFRFNSGGCLSLSGPGSPENTTLGKPCDTYLDTTNRVWYIKLTGTNTTAGWMVGFNASARINGNLDVTGYVGSPGYVSQIDGYRIDNLGAADFRYLYADELHVRRFIADLEQALAGSQIISTSVAELVNTFTCPALGASATITVRDLPGANAAQVFRPGDYVVVRNQTRTAGTLTAANCVGTVSVPVTPGGTQSWTFTRLTGQNGGAMVAGAAVEPGTHVLDFGVPGNGFYEVNAVDGLYGINSPYMQIATWLNAPTAGNLTLRARVGNLRGITGQTEWGAIFGTYNATPTARYLRLSDQAFEARNLNFSMFNSTGVEVIRMDAAAPSFAIGNGAPTSYTTGVGFWAGIDVDGISKWRVGNMLAQHVAWTGTNLVIAGDGGGITNINGNGIQSGTVFARVLAVGTGRNLVVNSECVVSTETWQVFSNAVAGIQLSRNFAPWRLADRDGTCYMTHPGTPANGTTSVLYNDTQFPVSAGSRYEASGYLGIHRSGPTTVALQFLNASNVEIGLVAGNACTVTTNGGAHLSQASANGGTGYCRSGIIANAPAGAVSMRYAVYTTHTAEANPYVFLTRAYIGEALPNQTELTPWGSAGFTEISEGMIRTNAVRARHIGANEITANMITSGTFQGVTGIFGGVTLNPNGITLQGGDFAQYQIKWTGGSRLYEVFGSLEMRAAGDINLFAPGSVIVSSALMAPRNNSGTNLGLDSLRFGTVFTVDLSASGTIYQPNFAGGGNRTVCVNNNGQFYRGPSSTSC